MERMGLRREKIKLVKPMKDDLYNVFCFLFSCHQSLDCLYLEVKNEIEEGETRFSITMGDIEPSLAPQGKENSEV